MTHTVDLNSDLGEGFGRWTLGDDDAMLDLVTSANVACGFHAGDPSILRRVCASAAERGVAIGAQVGHRDLAGFGRRHIEVDPAELVDEVIYQIGALDAFARVLDDGACGVLVRRGDASTLARVLVGLLADPRRRAELAAAGRVRAMDFDWSVVAAQVLAVYETVAPPGGTGVTATDEDPTDTEVTPRDVLDRTPWLRRVRRAPGD